MISEEFVGDIDRTGGLRVCFRGTAGKTCSRSVVFQLFDLEQIT